MLEGVGFWVQPVVTQERQPPLLPGDFLYECPVDNSTISTAIFQALGYVLQRHF